MIVGFQVDALQRKEDASWLFAQTNATSRTRDPPILEQRTHKKCIFECSNSRERVPAGLCMCLTCCKGSIDTSVRRRVKMYCGVCDLLAVPYSNDIFITKQ
jgi:hypothetical protein